MKEIYRVKTTSKSKPESIVQGDTYRITVLTESLLRLEYSEDGIFEDRPSQTVWNRDFETPKFRLEKGPEGISIRTKRLLLTYSGGKFSKNTLRIQVFAEGCTYGSVWHYSDPVQDLGGTARTLDEADGAIPLGHGVISKNGFAVLDDSRSLLLTEDGWVTPRRGNGEDVYFFGYGREYIECLQDFYRLCGRTPMLPRFALGNWWSRYHKYTEQSYMELMNRFREEKVPFSVAVIDMDWHLVDIDPKYGSGWTGYTWNRDFFPDPERFLSWLHERGMHVTLNVHPADGVQAHEEIYPKIAEVMGVDAEAEEPVRFDIGNPKFLEAYFTYLHHPHEKEGVDFWWIDWQQGTSSGVEGLDPLWMLNHYHFLDSGRDGKRPMTFSRYAGPGSHRYPVGFSGDTVVSWDSLQFQPYFTANAANIGYGWWSHDIGGHMQGEKNDEMMARWCQLGVFSPINRLHSTCNIFNGKEPWRYGEETHGVMNEFLRLRHRLIPYLYTMNHRAFEEGRALVEPMYYEAPMAPEAYRVPNEYHFGTELIAAPITSPRIKGINLGKVKAWLPQGIWVDFFTGLVYRGNREIELYRGLSSIPVLGKAGGIVPLSDCIFGKEAVENPESLTLRVFAGASGSFTLYEDDGETLAYEKGDWAKTPMKWEWKDQGVSSFTISPVQGDASLLPEKRTFAVEIMGCAPCGGNDVRIYRNGKEEKAEISYDGKKAMLRIALAEGCPEDEIRLEIFSSLSDNNPTERIFDFLNQAEIPFDRKDQIYGLVQEEKNVPVLLSRLQALELDGDLYKALCEILTAMA